MVVVETIGSFKSIEMPKGFRFEGEEIGGRGENWLRVYRADSTDRVKISVRFSGFPLAPMDTQSFRQVLKLEPQTIFEKGGQNNQLENVQSVAFALGNTGDNQVCNMEKGPYGPVFELEKMKVDVVNGRKVVKIRGWFHGADMVPQHYFSGIFADGSPRSEECRVEELYLEAYTEDLYKEYLPVFEGVVDSLSWSN
jgi:hypothetical protein